MSWRIIFVSKPCKLYLKQSQLVYEPFEDEKVSLPLEDIATVILETEQINITSKLISEFAENDIAIFSCDASHMPNGLFLPFHQHYKYSEIAWLQKEWTEPFKKRIWQKIIERKLLNQSLVLKKHKRENFQTIQSMAKKVKSGDEDNREAYGAFMYWNSLFSHFVRGKSDKRNGALNYGYAILRGAVARAIVGVGFIPSFGVHHCNKLNAFNFADDVIEVFRPFIDDIVYSMYGDSDGKTPEALSIGERLNLVSVLTKNCLYNGEQITILKACELTLQSIVNTTKKKDYRLLKFPIII